jgi:hypothetical protein
VRKSDLLDTRKLQKNEREILGGMCVRGLDMKGFANVTRLEGTNTNGERPEFEGMPRILKAEQHAADENQTSSSLRSLRLLDE